MHAIMEAVWMGLGCIMLAYFAVVILSLPLCILVDLVEWARRQPPM